MNSRNGKRMMTAAGRFALSRFALNYTMFYETVAEQEAADGMKAAAKELHALVGRLLKGSILTKDVDSFRCRLIRESEVVMAYVDCFSTYDYVLERRKGRFLEEVTELETDEETVNRIMHYIVSAKETAEINQRVKLVLSELPIRFTKAKFFSMVRQALAVYEGTDKQALRQVLDMLRREALLKLPQGMEEGHEKLYQCLTELENADYLHMDKESFLPLLEKFGQVKESLISLSSDSVILTELINDLYVICLTRQDMLMDSQEKDELYSLISLLWERISREDYSLSEDELADRLFPLEGKQEAYYEQWSRFEGTDIDVLLGSEASADDRETAGKVDLLLSTSLYMSLEPQEKTEEDGILLSRKAVEEMCQPFFDDLETAWKGKAKCVVRAQMANLLSKLPMFFLNSDELREFLTSCISSCTDIAEKYASIRIINQMMETGDDLV